MVAEKLSRASGQQVIVENRQGANGFIAFEAAKRSAPDGHTLVQMDSFQLGTQQRLFKKLPYDLKDFEPNTTLVRNYFFVVVPANSPWKNMTGNGKNHGGIGSSRVPTIAVAYDK
jgi:tripartite-type tricarboxylate transporter receptor subunit TctC